MQWRALLATLGLGLMSLIPGSAQNESPRLYGGGTFAPSDDVRLEYNLYGRRSVPLSVYRIQNPERILELGGPQQFQQTKELQLGLLRTLNLTQPANRYYDEINLGRLPEGFYLAQIGNPASSATLILVTQLGLVVKSDPDSLLTYTASLQEGKPLPAQIYVVKDRKIVQEGRAHAEGLLKLRSNLGNNENLFVAARSGASWAFSSAYWQSWNLERFKVYLHTDRPVYRPGQKVFFKGIARSASTLRPLANQRVQVQVRDQDDSEVFSAERTTDAYGSFSGEFTLGLDVRLGNYNLIAQMQDQEAYGEFEVQEYRKPEYRVTVEAAPTVAVQGDKARFVIKAEYLFGGPVAGGKVNYSLIQRSYYRFAYRSSFGFYQDYEYENSYEGKIVKREEGRLNEKGELVVEWPLPRDGEDYRLSLEAGVTDEAGREINASGSLTAYRAGVVLSLETDRYAYKAGDAIMATVRAQDLQGRPVSVPFSIAAERNFWVRGQGQQSAAASTVQGRTDSEGKANVRLRFNTQGSYELTLSATDAQGRRTEVSDYLWVSDGSYWYWGYQSLKITPDKPEYQVGDTARFVIESPISDGYALINLEGRQIGNPELVQFQGSTFTYELKMTSDLAPNGFLAVTIVGGGNYYSEVAGFLLPPADKFLNVSIQSDKTSYRPGETARYNLQVTNLNKQPVKAQVTLGVVDEAIYLVRPEKAPDIRSFFWSLRDNVVGTDVAANFYFGNAAPAVAMAAPRAAMSEAVFGQSKEGLAPAVVRQDFRDTILWLPMVETDDQGRASVEVKLPDNLTEWRMTARVITLADQMGQNTQTIVSTLPVISRLATPRFLIKGDQATFKVIGQNNLSNLLQGQLQLEVSGLQLRSPVIQNVALPAGGRAVANYQVQADQSGQALLRASALTTAASDALQLPLPILPKGIKEELGWAGQGGDNWGFNLPPNTELSQSSIRLFLNPSLAAAVSPALSYLAGYPYGCSEQTMSRFLPSVLAKQAGGLAKLPTELEQNLDNFVALGLKRLYDFQHEDGGWGFWQNDPSSLYISAYVLSGLLQAQEAGYGVRQSVLQQGAAYLAKTLSRNDAASFASDAKAYAHYALAMGGAQYLEEGLSASLDSVLRERELTPYGLALATLAYARSNQTKAQQALDRLLSQITERERVAYWQVQTFPYAWNDDQVEATARGLEALVRLRPDHPVIAKVVNWLMLERKGARWVSTKDTAAVVVAALELAKVKGQTAANQNVTVRFNGQEQQLSVGPEGASLSLEGLQKGDNRLEVQGASGLFVSAGVSYFAEQDYVVPSSNGLQVSRTYERLVGRYDSKEERYVYERRPLSGAVKAGEYLIVTLNLRPQDAAARYVLLEEPTPAGFSVVENDSSFRIAGLRPRFGYDYYGWNYWFDGREIRDNGLEFYFSYVGQPVSFTYILRAETPGRFSALPTQAWLMYEPEVRGVGTLRTLSVTE